MVPSAPQQAFESPSLRRLCQFIEKQGQLALAAHLRGAFKWEWNQPELRLFFDREMAGQVQLLEKGDRRQALEEFTEACFGEGVQLVFQIKDDPARIQKEAREKAKYAEVENHPIVKLTKEIFHGKILNVEEGGSD